MASTSATSTKNSLEKIQASLGTNLTEEDFKVGHENLVQYLAAEGGRGMKNHILCKLALGEKLTNLEKAMAERVFLSLKTPEERMRMAVLMPYVVIRCPSCHYHSNLGKAIYLARDVPMDKDTRPKDLAEAETKKGITTKREDMGCVKLENLSVEDGDDHIGGQAN